MQLVVGVSIETKLTVLPMANENGSFGNSDLPFRNIECEYFASTTIQDQCISSGMSYCISEEELERCNEIGDVRAVEEGELYVKVCQREEEFVNLEESLRQDDADASLPSVPDWSPTVLEDLDTEEPECIVDLASIFELPLSDLPDIRVIQESTTEESNSSRQSAYGDIYAMWSPSHLDLVLHNPWIEHITGILKPHFPHGVDLMCYFTTVLYHTRNASVFSLPLPLMLLFWWALRKPRPSATFWNIIIAYIGVATVVKWLMKLSLLPFQDKSLWFPTLVIDLKMEIHNIFFDLMLLILMIILRLWVKFRGMDSEFERDGPDDVEQGNDTHMRTVIPASSPEGHLADHSAQDPPEDNMRRDGSGEVYLTEHRDDCFVVVLMKKCCSAVWIFFHDLTDEPAHCGRDVYMFLLLCDIINFVVTIFGFRHFGFDVIGETEVTEHLAENNVPTRFVVLLILQFALIIVDRALYLCRCIKGKVLFYFFVVIGVHAGMFFLIPSATQRKFSTQWALQLWYMVKCIWFLLSAYQIRNGYPSCVLGNSFCRCHGLFNFVLVKGFLEAPFLFELRTILDWLCSDTSLSMFKWLKMEVIYYSAFLAKCSHLEDQKYPRQQGSPKKFLVEYFIGAGILLLITGALFFPLIFFSFSANGNELPSEVTIIVGINNYPPIYSVSVQSDDIISMDGRIYNKMRSTYMMNKEAVDFLNHHKNTDVAVVRLGTVSDSVWTITQQQRWNLIENLQSNASVNISVKWCLSWVELGEGKVVSASDTHVHAMDAEIDGKPNPERVELLNLVKGEQHSAGILNVFPKFIRFSKHGKALAVPHLMKSIHSPDDRMFRNVTLQYKGDDSRSWEIRESCNDPNFDAYISRFNTYDIYCHKLTVFVFNDQSFPKVVNFLSKEGIIGLYIGGVYLLSCIIRAVCGISAEKMVFYDMMNVDRILQVLQNRIKMTDKHPKGLRANIICSQCRTSSLPLVNHLRSDEVALQPESQTQKWMTTPNKRLYCNEH